MAYFEKIENDLKQHVDVVAMHVETYEHKVGSGSIFQRHEICDWRSARIIDVDIISGDAASIPLNDAAAYGALNFEGYCRLAEFHLPSNELLDESAFAASFFPDNTDAHSFAH